MSNVNLTIDDITRESLRVLHQQLNFCTNFVTDYDDKFVDTGAKKGDTIRVRLPIQHNTGTGSTMATGTGADTIQTNTTVRITQQRHVPMRFTTKEMALDIDDFSSRHIKPAMTKLAAMIENDAFATILPKVPYQISAGTKVEFAEVMNARMQLQRNLAPGEGRIACLDPQANVDLVVDNKGLFQDASSVGKQYKEGAMGRFGSFDFYENSIIPQQGYGTSGGTSAYDVNGASQDKTLSATSPDPTTQSLTIDTGTKVITKGQVFTIDGVYDVHPETKATLPTLKPFAVTGGDTGAATATSITITPAIIASGPYKNVSAAPANNATITFAGAASTNYWQSVLFQKGFAVMGTADLALPPKEEATRQVYEGISMRLVKDAYDVVKDRLYTRLDVLYGFDCVRPDQAVRILHT
jgi:hypothetical protein